MPAIDLCSACWKGGADIGCNCKERAGEILRLEAWICSLDFFQYFCCGLENLGLRILADQSCRAPHVTTIVLPETIKSLDMGKLLEDEGILVSYRSEYLVAKNYIQICFMGECQKPPRMITYFLHEALKHVAHDIEVV